MKYHNAQKKNRILLTKVQKYFVGAEINREKMLTKRRFSLMRNKYFNKGLKPPTPLPPFQGKLLRN